MATVQGDRWTRRPETHTLWLSIEEAHPPPPGGGALRLDLNWQTKDCVYEPRERRPPAPDEARRPGLRSVLSLVHGDMAGCGPLPWTSREGAGPVVHVAAESAIGYTSVRSTAHLGNHLVFLPRGVHSPSRTQRIGKGYANMAKSVLVLLRDPRAMCVIGGAWESR